MNTGTKIPNGYVLADAFNEQWLNGKEKDAQINLLEDRVRDLESLLEDADQVTKDAVGHASTSAVELAEENNRLRHELNALQLQASQLETTGIPDFRLVRAEALQEANLLAEESRKRSDLLSAESLRLAEKLDKKGREIADLNERLVEATDKNVKISNSLGKKGELIDKLDAQLDDIRERLADTDDITTLYKELCEELGAEPKEIGMGCPVHDGQVHGKEASELRKGMEDLIKTRAVSATRLQLLLDEVDARDSLAHEERERDKGPDDGGFVEALRIKLDSVESELNGTKISLRVAEDKAKRSRADANTAEDKLASCQDALVRCEDKNTSMIVALTEAQRIVAQTGDHIAFRGRVQAVINISKK